MSGGTFGILEFLFSLSFFPLLLLLTINNNMKIQILVPSQNQKSFSIDVGKDDTVVLFRNTIMDTLNIQKGTAFSLIALGKIVSVCVCVSITIRCSFIKLTTDAGSVPRRHTG